jgi:TPR repeat protein
MKLSMREWLVNLAGCGCMLHVVRRLLQWKQLRIRGLQCARQVMRRVTVGHVAASPEGCFEEGLRLYAAGRFKDAAPKLEAAAAGGILRALAELAWLLWYGREGVVADRGRALALAEQGARVDCMHCKGLLAIMIMFEENVSKDVRKAHEARSLRLACESAAADSKWGQLALAEYHGFRTTNRSDELYRQAAAQGLDEAQFLLGCNFDSENGGSDDAEALRWYTLAADQGHPEAMFHVAQYNDPSIEVYVTYEDRQGYLDQDVALYWYKRAAAAGHENAPLALHRLGEYDEALRWLLPLAEKQKAASKGRYDAELCFAIGQCYEGCLPPELYVDSMTGCENWEAYIADHHAGRHLTAAEKAEAIRWHTRAAAAGSEEAAFSLHLLGEYAEALRWLLPLAHDESSWSNYWACQKVAQCYEKGLGVTVDKAEAQRWLDR